MFTVEMRRQFKARQGLASHLWQTSGRPPVILFAVTLRAAFEFTGDQLDEDGRFIDTDTLEQLLDDYADRLSTTMWTDLFDQRPTFEFVTKWLYEQLAQHIPQLAYVSLDNDTIGVATTYRAD
ncbi:6-carboxytetrahydropterin synthase [Nocardia sp. NPDC050712]|uniref:6-carboxytetrahydropterin synthase n=1 Tax=Nocardia sp. NPDC050712 TaxID=3155518 RepID=UPI003403D387